MSEPDAGFDRAEVAEAERLDAQIDALLGGSTQASDPLLWGLAVALRTDPPAAARRRVAAVAAGQPVASRARPRVARRATTIARWAAAALALLFIGHGVGNTISGEWVAAGLGEPYSPHAFAEGAWAIVAAGLAVGAGALRTRFLPVSVGAGVPLGTALGVHGVGELSVFAYGAALHLTEGVVAAVLLLTGWLAWRYGSRAGTEERS